MMKFRKVKMTGLHRHCLIPAICTGLLFATAAANADPLTLWGAGSLVGALGEVATNFTAFTGVPVTTRFGPSGTLRQEIEAGARPDLFASADTGNPLKLQAEGLSGPVVNFASNRVVAVVAPGINVNSANLLSLLLDPSVTLGTSTPVADPLGDYTEQVFANADAIVPGAKATLDAKAQRLIASPMSPPVPVGQNSLVYFIDTTRQADIFLTYYTSAIAALQIAPDLQEIDLPSDIAASAEFGMTAVTGSDPETAALENYILSDAGQSVLTSFGFGPPAEVPEPASLVLFGVGLAGLAVVQRRRQTSRAS